MRLFILLGRSEENIRIIKPDEVSVVKDVVIAEVKTKIQTHLQGLMIPATIDWITSELPPLKKLGFVGIKYPSRTGGRSCLDVCSFINLIV